MRAGGLISKAVMALAVVLLLAGTAIAHRAEIEASVENGTLHIVCRYNDGKPMKQARLTILGDNDETLVLDKTDNEGKFNFPLPENVQKLKVIAQDLLGHRAELELTGKQLKKMEGQ